MKKPIKILFLRTCPTPMFSRGIEILEKKYPKSITDLFTQRESAKDFNEKFRKTFIHNRPFFSLLSLESNVLVSLIRERYDIVVIFYNNHSGETYEPVKRMAYAFFSKKVLALYPNGQTEDIHFSEIFNTTSLLPKNIWLDGIIAGGMIIALYLISSIYGFIWKYGSVIKNQRR